MGFHRCKPALIISLKCKNVSGSNPGFFSQEFSEKASSSERSKVTDAVLVTKTSSGEVRVHGSERLHIQA